MLNAKDIQSNMKQRAQLKQILDRAERIQKHLGPLLQKHPGLVHLRPTAIGVDMVGLHPDRPFSGRPAIKKLRPLADNFEQELRQYCLEAEPERVTLEQKVRAFLMRQAYQNDRHLIALEEAFEGDAQFLFVTDHVMLPHAGKRLACDLLAWDKSAEAPLVIEVGKAHGNPVNLQRVEAYSSIVNQQADLYVKLFSVLLGFEVSFSKPCRGCVLWPAHAAGALARQEGVSLLGFSGAGPSFSLSLLS